MIAFALALIASPATTQEQSSGAGVIRGSLSDADGQSMQVGHAVVFLCDAESGLPLSPKSRKPVDLGTEEMFSFDGFWHAVTKDNGVFEFEGVPPGTYRLVAQAWAGIAGMPRGVARSLRTDPGVEPSSVLILYGTAEAVVVKAGEATLAMPRQMGSSVQRIICDPEEPHNYVLISRQPMIGEPVLGPAAWGREFITGVVSVTRIEDPHLTVVGLPDAGEFSAAIFNYDNSAGMGGGSFAVGTGQPARLPIYAYWSNGKDEPPFRLLTLTEHLEATELDVSALVGLDRSDLSYADYVQQIWTRANESIEVKGMGEVKLIDLLAADSYRSLRKHHRNQAERRAGSQAQ